MWLISVCGHPNFQPPILSSLLYYMTISWLCEISLSNFRSNLFLLNAEFLVTFHLSGSSYSIRTQRWRVEKCVLANGWRTLETANKQGLLHICGNKEGAFPVTCGGWKVILYMVHCCTAGIHKKCIICNFRYWLTVTWNI